MIKKIEMPEMDETYKSAMFAKILGNKINELVDAVNGILDYAPLEMAMKAEPQTRAENVQPDAETRPENVQDPTKWIGKLCKFWDGDKQMSHLCWGILYTITPTSPVPYCCSLGDGITSDYEHCEPVLPDDNIIYKGDDNETLE